MSIRQEDVPPEWIFLQYFPDYQDAAAAVISFAAEIIRNKRMKDYKVSTVVRWSSGWALYAIPPGS